MNQSEVNHPLLNEIRANKREIQELFDEGEITTDDYQQRLDGLFQRERGIYNQMDHKRSAAENLRDKILLKMVCSLVVGLIVGFLISPHLYKKIFGYESAEECALENSTKVGMVMCFRLYEKMDRTD